MKRAFWFLSALVGVGGMVYLAGQIQAQAPAPGGAPAPQPAARPAGGKVAVFNVARVMRDYKKWQHYATIMQNKRNAAAAELGKLRNDIVTLQEAIQKEQVKTKQEEMAKQVVAKQREFEDKDKAVRSKLDDESAGYLRQLFAEVQQCVKAIVDTNGYDIVFAYPDAITPEEMASPLYYDLKLRPPAAMPFYISPGADVTGVLLETLNKYFPPPAEAVQPTGGATPPPAAPAPGTPPKK